MKSPFVRRSTLDRTVAMYVEERATREERVAQLEDQITRGLQVLSGQDHGTVRGGSGIVIGHPPYRGD